MVNHHNDGEGSTRSDSVTGSALADGSGHEETTEFTVEGLARQRILVTGGGGFIGSNFVRRIAPHADVTVLDAFTSGNLRNMEGIDGVTVETGDIQDQAFVDRVMAGQDVLVHMAAMAGVQRTIDHPSQTLEVNVEGTRIVLFSALEAGIDRVLFTSTSEMYGDLSEPPYREDGPIAPKTNYAVAKAVNERYVEAYCTEAGVPYTIVRYFNVYGPNQDGSTDGYVVPKFVRSALGGGRVLVYGSGRQTRDFTYIDDAIDGTIRALGPAGRNDTFNIGTGRETSIRELAELVTEVLDCGEVVHIEDPRPYRVERRCADITKARIRLGYEPRTMLSDGIRKIAETLLQTEQFTLSQQ
ncbi:NAD-dependent epimerase/dehydratase family protein [Saliphagus infecundisoli]|uniref:NAD-dependent epimerase/dehydratase family protein n=1 Tax=Saliphagus infecundisoli TaxID=1849069 RepID=A0ABD5QHL8_9EURY|nr:NAD-dependent epimerase/dehydratase family protein [Saliphagus infecundisoli]